MGPQFADTCNKNINHVRVPDLGYGQQGAGDIIPGDSTLIFDIELLDVEEGPKPVNVFKQIDADADAHISRDELADYLKQQVNDVTQIWTFSEIQVLA